MKNIFFLLLHNFLHNNLLILFINALCYCKALNNDGNKWLLIDVNPKIRLLDVQKIPKAQKFQPCLSTKFTE